MVYLSYLWYRHVHVSYASYCDGLEISTGTLHTRVMRMRGTLMHPVIIEGRVADLNRLLGM